MKKTKMLQKQKIWFSLDETERIQDAMSYFVTVSFRALSEHKIAA